MLLPSSVQAFSVEVDLQVVAWLNHIGNLDDIYTTHQNDGHVLEGLLLPESTQEAGYFRRQVNRGLKICRLKRLLQC